MVSSSSWTSCIWGRNCRTKYLFLEYNDKFTLSCVDTGSQVCNLVWSKNVNEQVSTHGYSQNQIIVWRYPTLSKLASLTGHTYRVLYVAISQEGQMIVTGAGDETLRSWNVFPSPKSQNTESEIGASSLGRTIIRLLIRALSLSHVAYFKLRVAVQNKISGHHGGKLCIGDHHSGLLDQFQNNMAKNAAYP